MRKNVKDALAQLSESDQEKLLAYRNPSSRLGKKKTANYNPSDKSDYGLKETMTVEVGLCPCSECGHVAMFQCEEAGCECCSSACC